MSEISKEAAKRGFEESELWGRVGLKAAQAKWSEMRRDKRITLMDIAQGRVKTIPHEEVVRRLLARSPQ